MLRGWRQFGRCAVDVRCHVSSVYPAARVFTFGSTCMQAGGERGANIISGGDRSAPKKQLPSGNQKRGSLQKSTKGTFRCWGGEMQPPGGAQRMGLEVVLFPAVWELSRGSLPSARGYRPLYRMSRPTARIAWTVQPMRPPQRDRDSESGAFPLGMMGWCGKPVPSAAGVLCFLKQTILAVSHLSQSRYPLPATRCHRHNAYASHAHEACHNVRP